MNKIYKYGKRIMAVVYAAYFLAVLTFAVLANLYGDAFDFPSFLTTFLGAGGVPIALTVVQAVVYRRDGGVFKRFTLFASLQGVKISWAGAFTVIGALTIEFGEGRIIANAAYLTAVIVAVVTVVCETVALAAFKKCEIVPAGESDTPAPPDAADNWLSNLAFGFAIAFMVSLIFCLPFSILFILFWFVSPALAVLSLVSGVCALCSKRKPDRAGTVKAVIAVIAPAVALAAAVVVLLILPSMGIAVIRFM